MDTGRLRPLHQRGRYAIKKINFTVDRTVTQTTNIEAHSPEEAIAIAKGGITQDWNLYTIDEYFAHGDNGKEIVEAYDGPR